MHENLFDHIDIPAENINIPSGIIEPKKVRDYCKAYEKKIADLEGSIFNCWGLEELGMSVSMSPALISTLKPVW